MYQHCEQHKDLKFRQYLYKKIKQKHLKVQLILVTRILSVKNLLENDDSLQSDFISQSHLTSMAKPVVIISSKWCIFNIGTIMYNSTISHLILSASLVSGTYPDHFLVISKLNLYPPHFESHWKNRMWKAYNVIKKQFVVFNK